MLKDQKKTVLFHYICQLLPEETQHEFDRIAAEMLARGMSEKLLPSNAVITYTFITSSPMISSYLQTCMYYEFIFITGSNSSANPPVPQGPIANQVQGGQMLYRGIISFQSDWMKTEALLYTHCFKAMALHNQCIMDT